MLFLGESFWFLHPLLVTGQSPLTDVTLSPSDLSDNPGDVRQQRSTCALGLNIYLLLSHAPVDFGKGEGWDVDF